MQRIRRQSLRSFLLAAELDIVGRLKANVYFRRAALTLAIALALESPLRAAPLDEKAVLSSVASWRASLSVRYPEVVLLVEWRQKWARGSEYLLLTLTEAEVSGRALLVEPPTPEDPSRLMWNSVVVSGSTCPAFKKVARAFRALRPPPIPTNTLTLDPATYEVTVATASSRTSYRLAEPEGAYWGDPGARENDIPAWVRHAFEALKSCGLPAA